MPVTGAQKTSIASLLSTVATLRLAVTSGDDDQLALRKLLTRFERDVALIQRQVKGF
jgi:hypothetical protein